MLLLSLMVFKLLLYVFDAPESPFGYSLLFYLRYCYYLSGEDVFEEDLSKSPTLGRGKRALKRI